MTFAEQKEILESVSYLDWRFELHRRSAPSTRGHGRPVEIRYLQVVFEDEDNYNPGQPYLSKGRKWMISQHMTKSELVLTAWKAVLTAIEHEAREKFMYQGRTIFGPHIDVDELWLAAHHEEVRT